MDIIQKQCTQHKTKPAHRSKNYTSQQKQQVPPNYPEIYKYCSSTQNSEYDKIYSGCEANHFKAVCKIIEPATRQRK